MLVINNAEIQLLHDVFSGSPPTDPATIAAFLAFTARISDHKATTDMLEKIAKDRKK